MWGRLFGRPRVDLRATSILSGDLESVYVETKVDGVTGLASIADLIRHYQKVRHADNYVRQAKANKQ